MPPLSRPRISRRALLAAAAGAAGASLMPAGSVLASSPAAQKAAAPADLPTGAAKRSLPSAYRYKVGDITVTAIADGLRTIPMPEGFVRNAPREQVNAALEAAFMKPDEISIPFNVVLLEIGGKRILVDAGNGPTKGAPDAPVGLLAGTLAQLGIGADTIDEVVISHFHADHINGLLNAEGQSAFPKARVRVPQAEWAFWMDESEMGRAPERLKGVFANAQRVFKPLLPQVETFGWEKELAPGLLAVGTPGHTPGHTSFELGSGKDKLFIQSDLTNIPELFVTNPGWHVMFDMDAAGAEQVRRKIYNRLASERLAVAGYHFPFPGAAHVARAGDGFRYVPVLWNPVP